MDAHGDAFEREGGNRVCLNSAGTVEVEVCGHNTRLVRSLHVAEVGSSSTTISPTEMDTETDTLHKVESPPPCALGIVPLVGRLCLDDFEE